MNQQIFKQYNSIAKFLAQAFGKSSEIVIQSVVEENSGIVAIYNGEISGRKIGDPLTRFALKIIEDKLFIDKDFLVGYEGKSRDQSKLIQSSTYFIKDADDKLIGMLCINTDVTPYKQVAENILKLASLENLLSTNEQPTSTLAYTENISESIPDIIASVLTELQIQEEEKLDKDQKIEIISELKKKGIFNMKGAVTEVSNALRISEPSTYRYLASTK